MIVIQTDRLILRTYEEQDADLLHPILSDTRTMAFWPAPFTREQTKMWVESNIASYRSNGFGRWALVRKTDGRLIGDAGLKLSEIDGVREHDLGYIIAADEWGQGYGYEAANGCLRHGFGELGLHRICANMPVDHVASKRVAEKLGMRLEKRFYNVRNRNKETYLYAMTAERPGVRD